MSSSSNDNKKEGEKRENSEIPKTKAGEYYHFGAAKVSEALGDDEAALRHNTLAAAKYAKDSIDEGWAKAQERARENRESVREGVEKVRTKAQEGFELAEQTAEDGIDQVRDTVAPAADQVKMKVEGISEGIKEYFEEKRGGSSSDENSNAFAENWNDMSDTSSAPSSSLSERVRERESEIPQTVMGEFYHKAAAKVSEAVGDEEGAAKHEGLVAAKQAKEATKENLENVEDNLRRVGDNIDREARGTYGDLRDAFSDDNSSASSRKSGPLLSSKSNTQLTEDEIAREEFKVKQMDWLDM